MTPAWDPKQGNKDKIIIFRIFYILGIFLSKIGFLGLGRGLKSLGEVLRFVVTEYRGVGSHGDLIRDQNVVFLL